MGAEFRGCTMKRGRFDSGSRLQVERDKAPLRRGFSFFCVAFVLVTKLFRVVKSRLQSTKNRRQPSVNRLVGNRGEFIWAWRANDCGRPARGMPHQAGEPATKSHFPRPLTLRKRATRTLTSTCSGRLVPDTALSFSSATAGASPPFDLF